MSELYHKGEVNQTLAEGSLAKIKGEIIEEMRRNNRAFKDGHIDLPELNKALMALRNLENSADEAIKLSKEQPMADFLADLIGLRSHASDVITDAMTTERRMDLEGNEQLEQLLEALHRMDEATSAIDEAIKVIKEIIK